MAFSLNSNIFLSIRAKHAPGKLMAKMVFAAQNAMCDGNMNFYTASFELFLN
jgi:hypothetical protein